jgi:GTPase SAR1 family protein
MSVELRQYIDAELKSISSEVFEDLCLELLQTLGFRNVYRVGHHNDRDRGRDIEAVYSRMLPDGQTQIHERWFFECKHQKKNLSVEDIQSKVAWAEASDADFLVFLSFVDLTSSARQFIDEFQKKHRLKILAWTGTDLFRRFRQCPRVLKELIPQLGNDPQFTAQLDADERIRLARSILLTIGVLTPDLDSTTSKLLEEIISRCVRKEDVKSLEMESLGDGASEVVYLLSASGNKTLTESQLLDALTSILDRYPNDKIAWQIAKYFRVVRECSQKKTLRYVFLGPVGSGKSCLLAAILYGMLRDKRFAFEAETLLGLSSMHRSIRERTLLPATVLPGHGFRMHLTGRTFIGRSHTCLELLDMSGEAFRSISRGESYWGTEELLNRSDKVFLIFDPTVGRSLLYDEDEGGILPVVITKEILEQYSSFLERAKHFNIAVYPVMTKVDLVDIDELKGKTIPELKLVLPRCQEPIFVTSVLKKQDGVIVPQSIGIAELINWMST